MFRRLGFGMLCLWLALGIDSRAAQACATVMDVDEAANDSQAVRMTDEAALLIWDAKTATQHFVRRASFQTKSNFGFLVPTPSRPELGAVDNTVFDSLENEMKPKRENRTRKVWKFTPLVFAPFMGGEDEDEDATTATTNSTTSTSAEDENSNSVEVVEEKRVGDYDAAVLQANDAGALRRWLSKNRYAVTPGLEAWLRPYVARGWSITAFKIAANSTRQVAQASAVRLSFKTKQPFYPYREPQTAKQQLTARTLRVYLASDERMNARIQHEKRSERWPGQALYSAAPGRNGHTLGLHGDESLEDEAWERVLTSSARLSVFDDSSTPRPAWGELEFARDENQDEITPAPHIIWQESTMWIPFDVLSLGIGGAWWLLRRRNPSGL